MKSKHDNCYMLSKNFSGGVIHTAISEVNFPSPTLPSSPTLLTLQATAYLQQCLEKDMSIGFLKNVNTNLD